MESIKFIRPKVAETEGNPHLSPFACACGAFLTFRQLQQVQNNEIGFYTGDADPRVSCLGCGKGIRRMNTLKKMVSHENETLLDATVTKSSTWYHATYHKNWMKELQHHPVWRQNQPFRAPYVHIGTLDASLDIAWARGFYKASEKSQPQHKDYYLYEITLSPETVVSKSICLDENSWPARVTEETRKLMRGDVLRYLNVWEAPGSISMVVDSSKLVVQSVRKLTAEDCPDSYLMTKAKQAEAGS